MSTPLTSYNDFLADTYNGVTGDNYYNSTRPWAGVSDSTKENILNVSAADYAAYRNQQYYLENLKMQQEYNSPAAQMQRFAAAGLNPNLIYSQGNSGNVTSSPVSYSAPKMKVTDEAMRIQKAQTALSGISQVLSVASQAADTAMKWQNFEYQKPLLQFNSDIAKSRQNILKAIIGTGITQEQADAYGLDLPNIVMNMLFGNEFSTQSSIDLREANTAYRQFITLISRYMNSPEWQSAMKNLPAAKADLTQSQANLSSFDEEMNKAFSDLFGMNSSTTMTTGQLILKFLGLIVNAFK